MTYSPFLASSQLTMRVHPPDIVLSMFMLSFIYVRECVHFERKWLCAVILLLVYICISVGYRSRGEGCDPITQFNPATFWCLSWVRIWISNTNWHGPFLWSISWGESLWNHSSSVLNISLHKSWWTLNHSNKHIIPWYSVFHGIYMLKPILPAKSNM